MISWQRMPGELYLPTTQSSARDSIARPTPKAMPASRARPSGRSAPSQTRVRVARSGMMEADAASPNINPHPPSPRSVQAPGPTLDCVFTLALPTRHTDAFAATGFVHSGVLIALTEMTYAAFEKRVEIAKPESVVAIQVETQAKYYAPLPWAEGAELRTLWDGGGLGFHSIPIKKRFCRNGVPNAGMSRAAGVRFARTSPAPRLHFA